MRGQHGGVGFCRRAGVAGMEGRPRLHHLPALHLQSRPALRHGARLQPLAKAITPGPAPEEALQALGADSAERDGTAA